MPGNVRDNVERSRFEMPIEGVGTAFALYRATAPAVLAILHVEVPPAVKGRGYGARLMAGALDLVRDSGRKVVPYCSYAAAFIRRHPEYHDLLA